MRVESVEIYSDQTNAAILRHLGRRFPGMLVQGDNLYAFCQQADLVCEKIGRGMPAYKEANDLRNILWSYLNHYEATLAEHIPLPFSDQPV